MTNLCNHQANKRDSAALVVEMGTTPLTSNDQFSVTLKEFYHVKGVAKGIELAVTQTYP